MITSRDPDSNIVFSKKRDDFIQRIFSAHLLLKDPDNFYIPTNTVDIEIPYSTLEEKNFTFKLGSIVIFDVMTNKYRFIRDDEYPERYLSDPMSISYAIPYLMELKLSPPRISYVDMNVDDSTMLDFKFSNDKVDRDFVVSDFKLQRNPLATTSYVLSCSLLYSGKEMPQDNIHIIAVMSSGTTKVCWFKMTYESSSARYVMQFDTNDEFNSTGKLILNKFGEYPIYSFKNSEINEISITENVGFDIGVFYDQGDSADWDGSLSHDEFRDVNLNMIKSSISNSEFHLAIKLKSATNTTFFKLINDVMHSQVTVTDSNFVKVSDVPLVGLRYFYNTQRNSNFYSSINNHIALIRENLDKIENNFDIDLKFYNTYGRSILYDTVNVHISIDLSIKLKVVQSSDLDIKIKNAIKGFIIDSNLTSTRKMSVSNLNTFLETSFTEISYIIFNGVNDLNIQAINYLYSPEQIKEQRIRCAPEFLNVALVDAGASALRSSEPNIKITYL
jgi:hypothetical protein